MTYADYPLTVYAFHGCSREVAEAVLAGEMDLKPSRNAYDWIGSGVYFWENAPERALRWAEAMHTKNPAVTGAVVSLGHCLNLMDKSSNAPLSDAFRLVSGLFSDKGEQMPANVRKRHIGTRSSSTPRIAWRMPPASLTTRCARRSSRAIPCSTAPRSWPTRTSSCASAIRRSPSSPTFARAVAAEWRLSRERVP